MLTSVLGFTKLCWKFRIAASLLIVAVASTNASATTVPLTAKPASITDASCARWATEQDEDTLYM